MDDPNITASSPETLPRLLALRAGTQGGRPAMREKRLGIWRNRDWAEALAQTRAMAAGLAEIGVARGARVGLIGDNRPELYWAICAAQMIGAIPVPLFQEAGVDEIGAVIGHAEIDVVIAEDQEQVDKLLALRAATGRPGHIVFRDGRGLEHATQAGLLSLAALCARGQDWRGDLDAEIARGQADDVAIILYTSGTTQLAAGGAPKGVMLSHANIIATARATVAFDGLGADDEVLAYLPMAWVGDVMFSFAQSLVAGFCLSCPESGETVLADLREIGPSYLIAPPRILETLLASVSTRMADVGALKQRLYGAAMALAQHTGGAILDGAPVPLGARIRYRLDDLLFHGPLRNALGLSRVRCAYVVGEAIGPDILRFYRGIGFNLKQLYGLTEASGVLSMQRNGQASAQTVGMPLPGTDIRLAPAGEVPDGEVPAGEVQARGPGIFLGYYRDEAATAAARTEDGWLRTGDIGHLEADGQLRITDRAADLGRLLDGTVFTPKFLENKLKFFPFIKEALAIGDGRDGVACLINIDAGAMGAWVERQGQSFSGYQDLAARADVGALVAGCVAEVNRDLATDPALARLSIRRFVLLGREFDAEAGELTRMRKLRRQVIMAQYAPVIAALDAGQEQVEARGAMLTIQTVMPQGVTS